MANRISIVLSPGRMLIVKSALDPKHSGRLQIFFGGCELEDTGGQRAVRFVCFSPVVDS